MGCIKSKVVPEPADATEDRSEHGQSPQRVQKSWKPWANFKICSRERKVVPFPVISDAIEGTTPSATQETPLAAAMSSTIGEIYHPAGITPIISRMSTQTVDMGPKTTESTESLEFGSLSDDSLETIHLTPDIEHHAGSVDPRQGIDQDPKQGTVSHRIPVTSYSAKLGPEIERSLESAYDHPKSAWRSQSADLVHSVRSSTNTLRRSQSTEIGPRDDQTCKSVQLSPRVSPGAGYAALDQPIEQNLKSASTSPSISHSSYSAALGPEIDEYLETTYSSPTVMIEIASRSKSLDQGQDQTFQSVRLTLEIALRSRSADTCPRIDQNIDRVHLRTSPSTESESAEMSPGLVESYQSVPLSQKASQYSWFADLDQEFGQGSPVEELSPEMDPRDQPPAADRVFSRKVQLDAEVSKVKPKSSQTPLQETEQRDAYMDEPSTSRPVHITMSPHYFLFIQRYMADSSNDDLSSDGATSSDECSDDEDWRHDYFSAGRATANVVDSVQTGRASALVVVASQTEQAQTGPVDSVNGERASVVAEDRPRSVTRQTTENVTANNVGDTDSDIDDFDDGANDDYDADDEKDARCDDDDDFYDTDNYLSSTTEEESSRDDNDDDTRYDHGGEGLAVTQHKPADHDGDDEDSEKRNPFHIARYVHSDTETGEGAATQDMSANQNAAFDTETREGTATQVVSANQNAAVEVTEKLSDVEAKCTVDAPLTYYSSDGDIDKPSTSYPRDKTATYDFIVWKRFIDVPSDEYIW